MDEVLITTAKPFDEGKEVIRPPNLPQKKIPIGKDFRSHFEKVKIINDCHAGALDVYVYGYEIGGPRGMRMWR